MSALNTPCSAFFPFVKLEHRDTSRASLLDDNYLNIEAVFQNNQPVRALHGPKWTVFVIRIMNDLNASIKNNLRSIREV